MWTHYEDKTIKYKCKCYELTKKKFIIENNVILKPTTRGALVGET